MTKLATCYPSVRYAPTFARMLKIPYPAAVKEKASQPVVWSHENTAHTGGGGVGGGGTKKKAGERRTMAARFLRRKQSDFSVHTWQKKVF